MKTFERAHLNALALTLPGPFYTSREIFDREQEAIFSREWICVGRSEQIVKAGDYFVATVAGESLIVVRDRSNDPGCDGRVRITIGTREQMKKAVVVMNEALTLIRNGDDPR